MAYIGRQLVRGQNRIYDDISSSFNGSTTAFNLNIGGSATPPAQVNQLWIVLGGILQKPGTDFTVADAQVTFTTAPASGLDFWAMIQGDTSDMNAPSDGSVTPTKIATSGDFAFPADVRFKDADGSHYVGLQAPTTVSSNLVWTLPAADGSANQILKTNGSGVLGWATDSALTLVDEDNMSSNSASSVPSQQSVKAYADTKAVLTGSTDNTICTVTGAHAITGEANLTYDGTDFTHKVNSSTAYSSTATPQKGFQVQNLDDTTNSFSALRLTSGTSSPATAQVSSIRTGAGQNDLAFQLETSNTAFEALRITSAGRLGIGTVSPVTLLHVSGASGASYLTLTNTTASDSDGNRYTKVVFKGTQSGGEVTDLGAIIASHDGAADDQKGRITFATNDGDDGTSPNERMRINSAGKIGIGTSSPSSGCQLTIAGGGLNITGQNTSHGVNSVRIGEEGSGKAQIRAYGSDASSYGSLEIYLAASDGSGSNNVMEFKKAAQGASLCFPSGGGIIGRGADSSTYGEVSVEVAASDLSGSNNVATFKKLTGGIALSFPDGGGIDFSAAGNSGGMTGELLDDYEEGTWTPAINGGFTVTYNSANSGQYVKVGELVHFQAYVRVDSVSGTSSETYAMVKGLPFSPSSNSAISVAVSIGWFFDLQTTVEHAYIGHAETGITLLGPSSGGDRVHVAPGDVWGGVARIGISGTFRTS